MIILVLICIAVMYAEPIKDGDLWFHMAYARYMIHNHTLIPDHTIYSWTPASGKEIYCAWLSEFVLYTLYQKGGLTLLFIFRYLCLAVFACGGARTSGSGSTRGMAALAQGWEVSLA